MKPFMKRTGFLSLLMALALLASFLPAPATLAEDYWICPRCGKRVREILGDMCPDCGYERHIHEWTPATCVTPKTCMICGETEGDPDLANHAGAFLIRDAQEATCRAAGYSGDVCCEACGGVVEQGHVVPALDHQWDEDELVHPATCRVEGLRRRTCTVCGAVGTEVLPVDPDSHLWDEGTVLHPATCTAEGMTRLTCTACGATDIRVLPIDPENHAGGRETRDAREASCEEAGYTGDTYCAACGRQVQAGTQIPALGHDWQAATCTAPKTCRVCGKTEGAAANHTWDQGETVREATCAATGLIRYRCAVCGAAKDEVLPVDPNQHAGGRETRNVREASCEEAGYTGDTYCAACGTKLADGENIPALGHDWQAATRTTPKTCLRCGRMEGGPRRDTAVGDIVSFGRYEQDDNRANGDEAIEWLVLDIDAAGGKALLISRDGLAAKPYDESKTGTTWAACSLRQWLNGDFLNAAFTPAERGVILMAHVDNSPAQGYSGFNPRDSGSDTWDSVFLLSYAEANRYFNVTWEDKDNVSARMSPTAYAISQGASTNFSFKTAEGRAAGWWWLRSPGNMKDDAAVVYAGGSLSFKTVNDPSYECVRPALWVWLPYLNGDETASMTAIPAGSKTCTAEGRGLIGTFPVTIGIGDDGAVNGIEVGEASDETTAVFLAMVKDNTVFLSQFIGTKGDVDPETIDVVSSATISSRGVANAVNEAWLMSQSSVGVAIPAGAKTYTAEGKGLTGTFPVTISIGNDGAVNGIEVGESNSEYDRTFLAMVKDNTAFLSQFIGTKGDIVPETIDAVSGATISSHGVANAVNEAWAASR